jgi:hypothetical protein
MHSHRVCEGHAPRRSFTLQHGSMISSLAATLATQPSVSLLLRNTIGVWPISCVTSACGCVVCPRLAVSGRSLVLWVGAMKQGVP